MAQSHTVLRERLPVVPVPGISLSDEQHRAIDRMWATAAEKLHGLVDAHPERFPLYTVGGRWALEAEAWTNWCEGFLCGELWLVALREDNPWFREQAQRYTRLLEPRKDDRDVHDLGFVFWPSYKRWFDLTGEPALDEIVVHAGRTLSLRFNEQGHFLRSFLAPDSLFIDIMMNVGIIFYAASRTGDPDLARIAIEHCLTSRRHLVRGDGSASHEGIFDLQTGEFLHQTTQQGWRDDASWARGLGWAIHGFGTAYRWTGDRRFLQTAAACAEFYLERTGDALVPPNDWEQPDPPRPYESSAAAITVLGLWQLSGLVADRAAAWRYGDRALAVMDRLLTPDFLACQDPAWEGILKHGSYHETKQLGVDESVMWGDYFLLAAVDTIERALTR